LTEFCSAVAGMQKFLYGIVFIGAPCKLVAALIGVVG